MISDDKKMAKRQRMVSKVQKMAVSSLPHSGGWSCAHGVTWLISKEGLRRFSLRLTPRCAGLI